MFDKYEFRRIKREIRQILLQIWDPIGIKDEPNAQDEYDGYLGNVYQLVVGGASDDSIKEQLCRIVTDQMGLSADKDEMTRTVEALRQIRIPQDSR